jgi:hypothetical protein
MNPTGHQPPCRTQKAKDLERGHFYIGANTYLNGGRHDVLAEYTEVEAGKGANALSRRPQLA